MSKKDGVRNPKYQRQYEDYDYYKARGICVNCGHEYAIENSIYCANCLEKIYERNKKYYEQNKEKIKAQVRESAKKRYWDRKARGLCTKCGAKAIPGQALCLSCHVKKVKKKDPRWNNDLERSERPTYGSCYVCAKPLNKHDKLCDECFDRAQNQMIKLNANPTEAMLRVRVEEKRKVNAFWKMKRRKQ